jgi:hypothetical protein
MSSRMSSRKVRFYPLKVMSHAPSGELVELNAGAKDEELK